jgi:hypothetical protein
MSTIDEACAAGIRGEVYAQEQVSVPRGTSRDYLEAVRDEAVPVMARFGWNLAGAWRTAMGQDSECFVLWAIPQWEQWADREEARGGDPILDRFEARELDRTEALSRILLVDSALSPMRLGRQPARSDRTEEWKEQP